MSQAEKVSMNQDINETDNKTSQTDAFRVIGITGGIGTGKSRVLDCLKEIPGAVVLEADRLAKELYEPDRRGYEPVLAYFGPEILMVDGRIDRSILGSIVFADTEKLTVLNEIMHPLVKEEILETIDHTKKSGARFFFLEAALLLQDGYRDICDEIWYIHADRETRLRRLMAGRGIDREKAGRVMQNQPSEEWYRERTDLEIDNSGNFTATEKQIRAALKI